MPATPDLGPVQVCGRCGELVRLACTEGMKQIAVELHPDHRGALVMFRDEDGRVRAYHEANVGLEAPPTPDRYLKHPHGAWYAHPQGAPA